MNSVRFSKSDAWIICAMSSKAITLEELIRNVTHLTRATPPSHVALETCISKAVQAGIVVVSENMYSLSDEWDRQINTLCEIGGSWEAGALEFEEVLASRDWPVVSDKDKQWVLNANDYGHALRSYSEQWK